MFHRTCLIWSQTPHRAGLDNTQPHGITLAGRKESSTRFPATDAANSGSRGRRIACGRIGLAGGSSTTPAHSPTPLASGKSAPRSKPALLHSALGADLGQANPRAPRVHTVRSLADPALHFWVVVPSWAVILKMISSRWCNSSISARSTRPAASERD
jgi:hypothetical protein